MPTIPRRAAYWLCIALAGLFCLPLAPITAFAQETPGLVAGATARIANADGDEVMLRDGPSYDDAVLAAFPEGTILDLTDGPIAAADGSQWFAVIVAGQAGYMVADYLVPTDDIPSPPAAEPPASDLPATETSAPDSAVPPATPPPDLTPAAEETTAETARTTDVVNLRADPSADAPVLLVLPIDSTVSRTGDITDGFAPVSYEGTTGWASIAYLELGAGAPAISTPTSPVPDLGLPAAPDADGTAATATDLLNLRAGPSYADEVLRVLPPGAPVTITGDSTEGFLPVVYNGTPGWIDSAYLDTSAGPVAPPAPLPPPPSLSASGTATTTDTVNLRADPSLTAPVVVVLPSGATVETTGDAQDGFYPITFVDQSGWVDAAYLRFDASPAPTAEPAPAATEPAAEAAPDAPTGGSGIIWPVSGGAWEIMQGYNGSSHQNQDSLWQYYYSLDLDRLDGDTAGQPVRSPVSGIVRWLDPATGGMSIDVGNGHAVAFFHVTVDSGFAAGDSIAQGQAVGSISGPGGPGFAGVPHIHLTLWETTDGGNWSRVAAPFVGPYAISGQEFPDTGGGNQYAGTEFTP